MVWGWFENKEKLVATLSNSEFRKLWMQYNQTFREEIRTPSPENTRFVAYNQKLQNFESIQSTFQMCSAGGGIYMLNRTRLGNISTDFFVNILGEKRGKIAHNINLVFMFFFAL